MQSATKVEQSAAPDEFGLAKQAWLAVKAKHKRIKADLDEHRAGAAWQLMSESERKADRVQHMRQTVARAFPKGLPKDRALNRRIEELQDELEAILPTMQPVRDRYTRALQVRGARIAEELQPEHREAVAAIAVALEQLNEAIVVEEHVRGRFATLAEQDGSAALPNCAEMLRRCRLDQWDSDAAQWARRVRNMRILP